MKKLLLSLGACLTIASASFSQTSLFLEDFETGGSSFSLNTGTLGGAVGLTGENAWVINNSYTGGSGTSACFGLSFTVGNTASQPAGVTNSPNSSYMHILSDDGTSNGITNANYAVADGSLCFFAESNFSEMTSDISTTGFVNVELDFWWTCLGDVNAFGEVYYSTDMGGTWNLVTAPLSNYFGSSSWANQVMTNAAWDNQATLRFGFRFVNNVAVAGGDPAFSVDDIEIFGTPGTSNTITTGTNIQPTSWCEGMVTTLQVDFTSTGTFNPGNIYTAELSDAAGSFAAPLAIGTLASTANTGMIVSMVPGSVVSGTGYRIRVVSDNPATIGTDNTVDLTIQAGPTMDPVANQELCNGDMTSLVVFTGPVIGTTFSWSNSDPSIGLTSGGLSDIAAFTATNTGASAAVGTITVTPSANGCPGTPEVFTITVNPSPGVSLNPFADVCDIDAPFNLIGGSPSGGTYSGPGVITGVFDPMTAGAGTHTISYSYSDPNTGCSGMAIETIFVDICGGIVEKDINNLSLFPNPTKDVFTLTANFNIIKVELLDMSGRSIKSFDESSNTYDVSEIPSGVYLVTVHTSEAISQVRLIVE